MYETNIDIPKLLSELKKPLYIYKDSPVKNNFINNNYFIIGHVHDDKLQKHVPVKIYNKNCIFNKIESGDSLSQINLFNQILQSKPYQNLISTYILPFYKRLSEYDFFPDVIFETESYIGVEWFGDDWRVCQPRDLFRYSQFIRRYSDQPTELFKDIIAKLTDLQKREKLNLKDSEYTFWKQQYIPTFMDSNNISNEIEPTIGPLLPQTDDIVVKKVNNKLIWKYTDLFCIYVSIYKQLSFLVHDNKDVPAAPQDVGKLHYYIEPNWHSIDLDDII